MMKIRNMITLHASNVLTQLVARVLVRMPVATGNVFENLVNDNLVVCASFLSSRSAETLDLCIEIAMIQDDLITVSADLVRGGSGEVFSETLPVSVRLDEPHSVTELLGAVDQYVLDQEDQIVSTLAQSIEQRDST